MRGYEFGSGGYNVNRFPEIDNPKTVYIFERGAFVRTDNYAKYSATNPTLKELKEMYGELKDKKKFK